MRTVIHVRTGCAAVIPFNEPTYLKRDRSQVLPEVLCNCPEVISSDQSLLDVDPVRECQVFVITSNVLAHFYLHFCR